MATIEDHPLRYALANELHARPFPSLEAPCFAVYLAIKRSENAAGRDRAADVAHLTDLLDRYGTAHPKPGANHFFGDLGKYRLKWESHTEFVTYTIFGDGNSDTPFDGKNFGVFPPDWLENAPGVRMTSALIRVERMPTDADIRAKIDKWFVPESMAATHVLDRAGIMAGDFRIDEAGHARFAFFAGESCSPRRIGRVVQRICEIETYKQMSMLGLARARAIQGRLGEMGDELSGLVADMGSETMASETRLQKLLGISADLERLNAETSFRFGATAAYEAIVNQRIEVLREERWDGRQTFREFMTRRYDPAMRTVKAVERQLHDMAERAIRAGDLLRTKVDVERSAENKALLESMDRRADLQLRLQETVEGLSVVAISYYAVSLLGYLTAPVASALHVDKVWWTAGLVIPVVLLVWLAGRTVRKRLIPH
ncbi:putative membrane-anchored protein [Maritimibacter alkaliphilus HTCC2654]|uniref:DUF3422 domain-containing protein n=1 Tax=Maritimibacter alkaliphilus HTCC2654 TaxID=314271 RepID=A3VI65_9RHOB|nr:DUF3422 domain-containing protein [Maritimibacter alkaliphilus]EAQ12064.1 hypothetical protein RB2654_01140 [Rhodobacterales bacterium HTCC2654] [Maritimibacter alkaliphilus HTCC2654]TYP83115.1 putative membrane-anchored protein [Maritimibacter alkaliphilus HTCC2654]